MKKLIKFRTLFVALSLFLLSLTSIIASTPHEHGVKLSDMERQVNIVCPMCGGRSWDVYSHSNGDVYKLVCRICNYECYL